MKKTKPVVAALLALAGYVASTSAIAAQETAK